MDNSYKDYEWLVRDIDNSLSLIIVYKNNNKTNVYGTYYPSELINICGDDVLVEPANIDDLNNLLSFGVIRFKNVVADSAADVVDIPLSNIYKLYENANFLSLKDEKYTDNGKLINHEEIEAFIILDGFKPGNKFKILTTCIDKPSEYLEKFMNIARDFSELGMQEKFNAISDINLLNYKRINEENNILRK